MSCGDQRMYLEGYFCRDIRRSQGCENDINDREVLRKALRVIREWKKLEV